MSATTPFAAYASLYDSLYRDKDYAGECDDLERIFSRFGASPVRRVLDFGCGTGGHATILGARGYDVTGVDRSAQMLGVARQKGRDQGVAVQFEEGDIRGWRGSGTWDAVLAMFAVVSYQIEHADVAAVIENARRHLSTNGLFIFDVWFGPGVMTDPPGERIKKTRDHDHEIVRHASSDLDLSRQVVHVYYSIIEVNGHGSVQRARETHSLRFFFPNELDLLLSAGGFRLQHLCPFGRLDELVQRDTWSATVVARAM